VAGAHPRAAAVEGRAPAPGLVLADGPALELRVRERGRTGRVEHAGHRPAVEGVDRLFRLRAREDVANIVPVHRADRVFYPLAARQDPSLVSVRRTRLEGTFPVSDATYCEGLRICNGAPDEAGQKASYGASAKAKSYGVRLATAKSCCYGGLRHSIKLYSPRMPTDWNCRGQTDPAIQAAVKADVPIKLK